MQLFAIAGGAGPGDEALLLCCGFFPILPLVVLLSAVALYRTSVWFACLALLLTGLPYVVLLLMVAGYKPSDDGDVLSDQATGRRAVGFYAMLAAFEGLCVVWVVVMRLVWWSIKKSQIRRLHRDRSRPMGSS